MRAINLCAAIAGRENGDARSAIDLLRVRLKSQKEKERLRLKKNILGYPKKKSRKIQITRF